MAQYRAVLPPANFKVMVVGADMMGINAAIKLQQAGFAYEVLEALDKVGGNWLTNTYPGAAVDTPSRVYSFSFESNASWPKFYPRGPEFLSYLDKVADKYSVREHMRFGAWVEGATWDEQRKLWTLHAARNSVKEEHICNALIFWAEQQSQLPRCEKSGYVSRPRDPFSPMRS